jgi:hypothetical protein
MKFKEGSGGTIDGKDFLSLKDGTSVRGVFAGEPHEFKQHWSSAGRSVLCTADLTAVPCEGCKVSDTPPNFRFSLNFILNENGVYVAKVWQQGWKVYKQLRALNEDYKLDRTVVKITRTGSTKNDTSYAVLPLPGEAGVVTPALLEQLLKVRLIELTGKTKPMDSEEHDANENWG